MDVLFPAVRETKQHNIGDRMNLKNRCWLFVERGKYKVFFLGAVANKNDDEITDIIAHLFLFQQKK